MQPEAALRGHGERRGIARLPHAWRAPLVALALAWAGLFALTASDWAAMAVQWWDISTYNHIVLVPAIVAWLVSLRAGALARLVPKPWWPGLVVLAAALFVWVLGSFAGVSIARQFAAVVMLQATVLALLGPRVCVALLFPLGYALFLVPAGEELVPLLQTVTARMTMALLSLTGVPAVLDGVFITTPAGHFKIAEACSGIKFLIAMAAFATLAANLCFRAWPRRLVFIGGALAVAILANGLRAWGTIVIAEWRGIAFASGFDHIFYGWIFFALVLALVMAAGWRWFDRAPDDAQADPKTIAASPALARLERLAIAPPLALGLVAALALGALGWSAAADRLVAPLPPRIDLPAVPGWHRVDFTPGVWWEPRHRGADHRLLGRYANAAGDTVDVSFALYAAQSEGREAGGFGEGAAPAGGAWSWASGAPAIAGGSGERLEADGPAIREAITWYRTGDLLMGSNARLKLANIADKLLLRRKATATLILSAQARPGHPAHDALARFVAATGDPGAWMDRVAATR